LDGDQRKGDHQRHAAQKQGHEYPPGTKEEDTSIDTVAKA
jgi:hypothetical protein